MSDDDLPVVLVSAATTDAADAIISELIDEEPRGACGGAGRVWQLTNKYYSARVRVLPRADGDVTAPPAPPPPPPPPPDAHLVHLAAHECASDAALAGRALAGEGAGAGADVRLAVCACAREHTAPALRRAADALGYELVWWGEADGGARGRGPFPERRGVARAREALHAHTWRNLRLHATHTRTHTLPRAPAATQAPDDEFSPFQTYRGAAEVGGEGERVGETDEEREEECMVRAEQLGAALRAAGAVRAGAVQGAGDEGRLLRAEQLLAAFCAALGTDIDSL